MLNFVRSVFGNSWDDHVVFLFVVLFMWWITFIDLHVLSQPCIPGIKPTWLWYVRYLMCCWILFPSILLRIFVFTFIRDVGLKFSFFVMSLCQILVSEWCWPYKMRSPSSLIFGIVSVWLVLALVWCLVEFGCESIWYRGLSGW